MLSKYVSVLWLMANLLGIIHCDENDHFFRNDYKYIKNTESFYKIHTLPKTWANARIMCEREGAGLFYPENEYEAEIVRSFWNETQPLISWIYIGVAAWNIPDVFDTVDGRSISEVYDAWSPGEPNNAGGIEGCVVMRKDVGTIKDYQCDKRTPFICKKNLGTLQWNIECDIPDFLYEYNMLLNRCYKFHLTPKNWTDAYAVCRAEQSYLAVINSEFEANHLVNLTAKARKDDVKDDYLRGQVHLGFKKQDGWITISGVPLHQSGYSNWAYGQPDNERGNEDCGSMFYNGQLNDVGCFRKMSFICEHEIKIRSESISLRFNSDTES